MNKLESVYIIFQRFLILNIRKVKLNICILLLTIVERTFIKEFLDKKFKVTILLHTQMFLISLYINQYSIQKLMLSLYKLWISSTFFTQLVYYIFNEKSLKVSILIYYITIYLLKKVYIVIILF